MKRWQRCSALDEVQSALDEVQARPFKLEAYIRGLKPFHVVQLLRASSLGEDVVALFRQYRIDGAALWEIDDAKLKTLGVSRFGDRERIFRLRTTKETSLNMHQGYLRGLSPSDVVNLLESEQLDESIVAVFAEQAIDGLTLVESDHEVLERLGFQRFIDRERLLRLKRHLQPADDRNR